MEFVHTPHRGTISTTILCEDIVRIRLGGVYGFLDRDYTHSIELYMTFSGVADLLACLNRSIITYKWYTEVRPDLIKEIGDISNLDEGLEYIYADYKE